MTRHFITVAAVLLLASHSALAAKPTSIAFVKDGTNSEGIKFANYIVNCSNGKTMPLTSWENGRQWCVGEESQELCQTKQLKAAKAACKIN